MMNPDFFSSGQCNVLIFFVKEGAIIRFFFISQTHDLLFLEKSQSFMI